MVVVYDGGSGDGSYRNNDNSGVVAVVFFSLLIMLLFGILIAVAAISAMPNDSVYPVPAVGTATSTTNIE
jgi:hypothetical protein